MAFQIPRLATAFSLDPSRKGEAKKEDPKHLAFIRKLPCTICGTRRGVEAAHIRYGDPAYAKSKTGAGQKPADKWTVPLCASHHRTGPDAQHSKNESAWWQEHRIDPCRLAVALFAASGHEDTAVALMAVSGSPRAQETSSTGTTDDPPAG